MLEIIDFEKIILTLNISETWRPNSLIFTAAQDIEARNATTKNEENRVRRFWEIWTWTLARRPFYAMATKAETSNSIISQTAK